MADLTMYGYTYEQWMDPERLRSRAQRDWDEFQAAQAAFELVVAGQEHWKGPIDAVISHDDYDLVRRAVGDRVGYSGLKITVAGEGLLRVRSPGYWANGF